MRQVTPCGYATEWWRTVYGTAMLNVPFVGDYNAANLLGVLATMRALDCTACS